MGRSIRRLDSAEYGQVFTLQRASFVDEARIYETPFVPALDETFDEFITRKMLRHRGWRPTTDASSVR